MITKKESIDNNYKLFIIIFALFAFIVPLSYSIYTGHIWEDFFITFKFSKNLADGNGLLYQNGIKVHGFTSPLGVLLPALSYLISSDKSYYGAIWIFRLLFAIPAFILGGYFIIKTFRESFFTANIPDNKRKKQYYLITLLSAIFATMFYIFDAKSLIFSVNGMETAFMLLFFAWAFYLLIAGIEKRWIVTGLIWGGLMWSRPDSCVYVAALMITTLIFSKSKLSTLIAIIKSSLVTTAIYLPWFAWTWYYYGTPIPHTITAKGSQLFDGGILSFLEKLYTHTSWIYAPVYPQFGGWPNFISIFATTIAIFAFSFWIIPTIVQLKNNKPHNELPPLANIAKNGSFLFFLLSFYLGFMTFPYPWYFPPVAMIGYIAITAAIFSIFSHVQNSKRAIIYPIVTTSIILIISIYIFMMTTFQMRIQQDLIENKTRTEIGKYLKEHAKPGDRIFLECLGYIGYFSEGIMLDYPGLCTPEVVKLLKDKKLNRATIIPELKPEWIVLRPTELEEVYNMTFFKNDYKVVKVFEAQTELNKLKFVPDSFSYIIKRHE